MPINSRTKGAVGERAARDAVKLYWGAVGCIRAAQANGSYSADLLYALPGCHAEVKSYEKIGVQKWMDRAVADAGKELPFVLMRQNRGEWLFMCRLKDSYEIAKKIVASFEATKPSAQAEVCS